MLLKRFLGLALLLCAIGAQAQTVTYNGAGLVYDDNKPYMSDGAMMLPARDTAERIGATFTRSESGRRIELAWFQNRVVYRQGETAFTLNGQRIQTATSSQSRNGILYLPGVIFRKLTDDAIVLRQGGGGGGNGGGGVNPGLRLFFDDRQLNFTGDQAIYKKQGITMVPFRALGDSIGAATGRTADGLRVTITFGDNTAQYDKGHIWFRINGNRRELRTTSEDRGGVLFVPVGIYEAVTNGRIRTRQ